MTAALWAAPQEAPVLPVLPASDGRARTCRSDKYARVAHPDVRGISGRTRIKQKYAPDAEPLTAWFPPKWKLNAAS